MQAVEATFGGSDALGSLLASIDRDSIGLSLCEVAEGVRLATPQAGGVATLLVLSGTMFLDVGQQPTRRVRRGELALIPAGTRAEMRCGDAPADLVLDGSTCLVRRDGRLIADATLGRERQLQVAAARFAGSASFHLPDTLIVPVLQDPRARRTMTVVRSEV